MQYSPKRLLCCRPGSFPYKCRQPAREKEIKDEKPEEMGSFIDTEIFNFGEWRKIYNRVMREQKEWLLVEGDPQGERELRKALADYTYKARGLSAALIR